MSKAIARSAAVIIVQMGGLVRLKPKEVSVGGDILTQGLVIFLPVVIVH